MTEENDFFKVMWDQKAKGEIIKQNNPLVAVKELADSSILKDTLYNGVSIDEINGLVVTRSDTKVKSAFNATDGIKIQQNTGTVDAPVWVDKFFVDLNGVLNLADIIASGQISVGGIGNGIFRIKDASGATVVQGDNTGMVVQNTASYRIKDIGGAEYTITSDSNMVNDHSFELVGTSGSVDPTYDDYAVISNGNVYMWNVGGAPRLVSNANRSYINGLTEFGLKAIACTSTEWVDQYIMVSPSTVYTLSGYAKPHPTRNAVGSTVVARFYVSFHDSDLALISVANETLILTTNHGSSGNVNLDLKRHKYTFTTPSNCITVRIIPCSLTTEWVIWDGMQLVKGVYPSLYNPDNQLWNYINQAYGFSPKQPPWAIPSFVWSGNIVVGGEVTITHNLGYSPIIGYSSSIGGYTITVPTYLTDNTLKIYGGSTGFNGDIYMY